MYFKLTRGINFLQKFISSRDGPVKSTENRVGMKTYKKITLLWINGGYYSTSAACTYSRCRVVFLSFILPLFYSRVVFLCVLYLLCFCSLYKSIPTWNDFLQKSFLLVSVVFRGLKPRNWTMNKMITILQLPKLPDSSI